MKRALSDRIITAARAASDGKPYDIMDTTTPALGIRVMPAAAGQRPSKTFILVARYGGPSSNTARRSLGRVGQITLDQAREKARRRGFSGPGGHRNCGSVAYARRARSSVLEAAMLASFS
jgi:hypothetical protein